MLRIVLVGLGVLFAVIHVLRMFWVARKSTRVLAGRDESMDAFPPLMRAPDLPDAPRDHSAPE